MLPVVSTETFSVSSNFDGPAYYQLRHLHSSFNFQPQTTKQSVWYKSSQLLEPAWTPPVLNSDLWCDIWFHNSLISSRSPATARSRPTSRSPRALLSLTGRPPWWTKTDSRGTSSRSSRHPFPEATFRERSTPRSWSTQCRAWGSRRRASSPSTASTTTTRARSRTTIMTSSPRSVQRRE